MRRAESSTTRSSGTATAQAAAIGEHWVVGEDGVDAGECGVRLPAQGLDCSTCGFTGDPVRLARIVMTQGRRDAAVECHRNFHENKGTPVLDPAGEAFIDATGFCLADAERGFDACGPQSLHAVAGDGGVGIAAGGDDPCDS